MTKYRTQKILQLFHICHFALQENPQYMKKSCFWPEVRFLPTDLTVVKSSHLQRDQVILRPKNFPQGFTSFKVCFKTLYSDKKNNTNSAADS